MKDYGVVDSRTKMFTIKIDGGVSRLFTFTKNGEIILKDEEKNVLVYNFDTGGIKYLGIEKDPFYALTLATFQDSLGLIEKRNVEMDEWESDKRKLMQEDSSFEEDGFSD
ncbi:hypothetical protein ACH5RR_001646 [Cinchona calisaya]|uniref:Uncharacterized protein n=1 Tax=Cinchona calisaya TaxID=153742 RepID=A0ABD3B4J4_9GENT